MNKTTKPSILLKKVFYRIKIARDSIKMTTNKELDLLDSDFDNLKNIIDNLRWKNGSQQLIKFMPKFDLVQTTNIQQTIYYVRKIL